MILLISGQKSARAFDGLLLFATQLDRRGHSVTIDARCMPDEVTKQQKFEAAPFLVDHQEVSPDIVLVVGADAISDEVQVFLRALQLDADVPIWTLGYFADRQDEITAQNKIAYTIGREPKLLNLAGPQRPALLEGCSAPLTFQIAETPDQQAGDPARLIVYVPFEDLEEPGVLQDLARIGYSAKIKLHVLTNGKGKELIRQSRYGVLSVFGYSELPPADIMNYADIVAFFGGGIAGERMMALALGAMGAGKVVIDCTGPAVLTTDGAPALKGPEHVHSLSAYLEDVVLDNRLEIGRRIQKSDWLRQFDLKKIEQDLRVTQPEARPAETSRTVYFPTNGNGLGHAQRCALIGEAMSMDSNLSFAAFPSCIDMLQSRGFACTPMVSRSVEHDDPYAADLVNHLRLRDLLSQSDQLVFDGGYVFDSVYRVISALQIPAIWIRRGLWQAGQIHPTALERERVFSRVIVPQEAFDELNTDYSTGGSVHHVGPIVRLNASSDADPAELRARLSAHFGKPIETLVVTMLGGGVASDRTAQTQLLCSLLEQRKDCLHLVIAWPNAVIADGLHGWNNTQVVRTSHTQDLCRAADLTVSAVGYNSFHEILYANVPSILIPQSAPYLDDQERRARAAADRGLATLVLESELLTLEREVSAFLDDGKADDIRAALAQTALPDPGNLAAATLIEEGLGA